ncbi:PH domain-containing protein [Candidatus Bathyarchaeota archaeon]|nr:PH domain-containing protein [Candidatus Bathyarchaeota archaeon]
MSGVDKLLSANEKIVWRGKPVKKAFLLSGLMAIPIGLIFLSFFIFWMWSTASMGAPFSFVIFGLPIVGIGLAVTLGPFLLQILRYRNTEYVITDKRIITQTGAIGLDTRFVDFEKVQEVYVQIGWIDRLFGTGSVYAMTAGFSGFSPRGGYGYGYGSYAGNRPSLSALEEPYEVQKLLQEAIETSKKRDKTEP